MSTDEASNAPEPVVAPALHWYVVEIPDVGSPRLWATQDQTALQEHLIGLAGDVEYMYVFRGEYLPFTRGKKRRLRLPDGTLMPLFQETLEPSPEFSADGFVGEPEESIVPVVEAELVTPADDPTAQAVEEDEDAEADEED